MSGSCHTCEEGLPEWIMSYADMITILMAFFVVMYSMAGNKDTAKEEAVLRSLRDQFGPTLHEWGSLVPPIYQRHNNSAVDLPFQGGTKRRDKNKGGAEATRSPEGDHARVRAVRPGEQARVGGVVFWSNSGAELSEAQRQALVNISADFAGKPQKIEIRGHSDRKPTGREAKPDSWDLAYNRCRHTMAFLSGLGIDPRRFRLTVAGDNEPLGAVDMPPPLEQNSRVEVFLLNEVVESQARHAQPPVSPEDSVTALTSDPS